MEEVPAVEKSEDLPREQSPDIRYPFNISRFPGFV